MMLMFDRGSRKSLNYLLSRSRGPIKGRASRQDAVMAKACWVPRHRTAGTNGLARQTAGRALGEARNLHCKPQCDGPASVPAILGSNGGQAGQLPPPARFPQFHVGRSVT